MFQSSNVQVSWKLHQSDGLVRNSVGHSTRMQWVCLKLHQSAMGWPETQFGALCQKVCLHQREKRPLAFSLQRYVSRKQCHMLKRGEIPRLTPPPISAICYENKSRICTYLLIGMRCLGNYHIIYSKLRHIEKCADRKQ